MGNPEIRRRVLNFRLTEEEYRLLRNASHATGARNISDFARSVLLQQHDHPPQSQDQAISRLESRLAELEERVRSVYAVLDEGASEKNRQEGWKEA